MPRSKHFLFASCGPQIPFTWCNAYWGLWVEPTRSWKVISSFHPCQAFSYGHLGWNLIQLSTGHVSFPFPSILFLQKKTKMYNTNRRYSGEIMVTKISSTVHWINRGPGWISRQWELWFFITRLLCLQNFKTLFSLCGLPLASVMCRENIHNPPRRGTEIPKGGEDVKMR